MLERTCFQRCNVNKWNLCERSRHVFNVVALIVIARSKLMARILLLPLGKQTSYQCFVSFLNLFWIEILH